MKTLFAIRIACAAALAASMSACSGQAVSEEPAAAETPAAGQTDETPGKSAQPMAWTGVLGEEEFKALHHLKEGEAPELHGETIDLAGGHAYLSLPEGEPPFPGIVVIQEWWGLNDNIKHWSDRLAEEGYAAIAVDLYDGTIATNPDEAMAAMQAVGDERAHEILAAGFDFLGADERVQATRRGCIGWCFGGGWSLQLALAEPELDACVMYYGRLVDDPAELRKIEAPLCGIFANRDRGIPPDAVAAFAKGLSAAGVEHVIHQYDAQHAFANPSNAVYDFENASAAWKVVGSFLQSHLKGEQN